jgi:hypothetical protein
MSEAERDDVTLFCSALLGGPDGRTDDRLAGLRVPLWTIGRDGRKRTRWSRADGADSLASAVSALAARQPDEFAHVFTSAGLVTEETATEKGSHRRAENVDVVGVVALHADIDIAGPGHKAQHYPTDVAAARTVYEAVGLEPTMVVHSGGGLHAWWCLAEPWLVADAVDAEIERQAMAHLLHAWSATIRYHAQRLGGWKIDSTFELSRLMRIPGTWNVKDPNNPVLARILDLWPQNRYEPDDFRENLADPAVVSSYAKGGIAGSLSVKELPGVDLNQVWARVTSAAYRDAHYLPAWLAGRLEILPGSALEATWERYRTGVDDPSPSGLDASLMRLLYDLGVGHERMAEALMCFRLRSGEKIEKVDPHQRTDYIVRTISFAQAQGDKARAARGDLSAVRDEHLRRAAGGRTPVAALPAAAPPVEVAEVVADEAPKGAPEEESARFADAVLDLIKPEPAAAAPVTPPVAVAARPVDAVPAQLEPVEQPVRDADPFPVRGEALTECMGMLSALLLPGPYREAGIEVWHLEFRDHGEAQRGRMSLRVPSTYAWPTQTPPSFRPGRPLYGEWYRRDSFDVPKGYRQTLIRDALMPALPVGASKEAWAATIDVLVPHWMQDSSGSDMVTQLHEWLLSYLVSHAPTTDEAIAVDNRRAFLADTAQWGVSGAPTLLLPLAEFLTFVAAQPGGASLAGRQGKTMLNYLHLSDDRRPRLTGSDGKRKRTTGWVQVLDGQFAAREWSEVLESARDALEASQQRKLRMIPGGQA